MSPVSAGMKLVIKEMQPCGMAYLNVHTAHVHEVSVMHDVTVLSNDTRQSHKLTSAYLMPWMEPGSMRPTALNRLRWMRCSCPGKVGFSISLTARGQFQYRRPVSRSFSQCRCSALRRSMRISSVSTCFNCERTKTKEAASERRIEGLAACTSASTENKKLQVGVGFKACQHVFLWEINTVA